MSNTVRIVDEGAVEPPDVPTQFDTDDGSGVPENNILNVLGLNSVPTNNEKGIESAGGLVQAGDTDNIGFRLTNRVVSTTQTNDAPAGQTVIAATLSLGTFANGTVIIEGKTGAYNKTDNLGAAYKFKGVVRVTAGALTEIAVETVDVFEEGAMVACSLVVRVDTTNFVVEVTGIAGKVINWHTQFTYTFTSGVTP